MGYGNYSHEAHDALLNQRSRVPIEQVFARQDCHALMNPKGVRVRESRDSADHPASLGIVFALDVTGSMGEIPKRLATSQLPQFMKVLTSCGIPDTQVLFMAVGDATCDRVPLQVGQFESTAELMDQWLTRTFLEGGGGGQNKESYELALYFLAQHTEMDCQVKRGKRGYLFMTGDEEPYPVLSKHIVDSIVGDRLDEDLEVEEIVAALQKSFAPFFLIPDGGRRARCEATWRSLLGDHVLCMGSPDDVCYVSGGALLLCEGLVEDLKGLRRALERSGIPRSRVAPVSAGWLSSSRHSIKPPVACESWRAERRAMVAAVSEWARRLPTRSPAGKTRSRRAISAITAGCGASSNALASTREPRFHGSILRC